MDRLETWNLRHGYPIEKTKEAMVYSLIVAGSVAGFVALMMLGDDRFDKRYHKTPYTDAYGNPLPN